MKKLLIGLLLTMMALVLVLGCTAKESEDATKEPAATQESEAMDTTTMDSAVVTDTTVHDTTM